jgi:ATP-dependent Zn protease
MPTTFDMSFNAYNCLHDTNVSCELDTTRNSMVSISDISNAYGSTMMFACTIYPNSCDTVKGYALYDLSMAYDTIHAKINDTSSNQVTAQQQKLDSELSEILTSKNIYTESQNRVDSAVLSGILWTTLAVTLVYFVFRKL